MINGLCKEGLFNEAITLLSKMEDNHCLPNGISFEIIIRALFENNFNDKAEKLIHEMIARGLLNAESKVSQSDYDSSYTFVNYEFL